MDEVKIEKGVPITARGKGAGRPTTPAGRAMRDMDIGDSFLTRVNRKNIYAIAQYAGIKIAVRKMETGEYRVWRIA